MPDKSTPNALRVTAAQTGDIMEFWRGGTMHDATRANLLKLVSGEVIDFISGSGIKLGSGVTGYPMVVEGVSFTEDGSGTSYTATVEIPAGAIVHDICFTSTVLWDGTSASLDIGDDDDPDGYFTSVNLKATDLLVGEVISLTSVDCTGGVAGAYNTTAGRKGLAAGGSSGFYYGTAAEIIFLVTPGAADGSAGRSFGWVVYSVPTFTASTNV
jgi:hypothetical protein